MEKHWEKQKTSFPVVDVRNLTTNFLPMILHKAQQVNLNNGICVIQSFEPKPLYSALADLGFEHLTEKISEHEFRVYFTGLRWKLLPSRAARTCPSNRPPS